MRRPAVVLVFVILAALGGLAGQERRDDAPRRPRLPANADTNSATTYAVFALRLLHDHPQDAAAAFYWAARLDPEMADYVYARRAALLMDDPGLFWASRRGTGDRPARARALDSLMVRALILDPFVRRRLDAEVIIEVVAYAAGFRIHQGADASQIEFGIRNELQADPDARAAINASRGQFGDALALWAREARENPRNPYVRAERARAFYLTDVLDSARAQMIDALDIARHRDADSTRFAYESKAAWEYSLGRILARLGDARAAREAFERALVEDLSYFPAHIQLGQLSVDHGDTAAGLREFARAVASREDEYLPRMTYGYFLASLRRYDSAAVHLRRAAELEPWAANAQLTLGSVLDASGSLAAALQAYERFLALAPRGDPDEIAIRARVVALRNAHQ